MQRVIVFTLLVCVCISGCVKHPRKKKNNLPAGQSATAIHVESAQKRADIYEKIAQAVEDGKLKTVNDVVDFSNPLFSEASQEYIIDMNALRSARLNGADDKLPDDAPAIFRKFADEYRQVGFVSRRK